MATTVNIYEAKAKLSKLVDLASQGEDLIIARNGKPAARLTALKEDNAQSCLERWKATAGSPKISTLLCPTIFRPSWECLKKGDFTYANAC
jgi:prevent-host-death family protein